MALTHLQPEPTPSPNPLTAQAHSQPDPLRTQIHSHPDPTHSPCTIPPWRPCQCCCAWGLWQCGSVRLCDTEANPPAPYFPLPLVPTMAGVLIQRRAFPLEINAGEWIMTATLGTQHIHTWITRGMKTSLVQPCGALLHGGRRWE